MRPLDVAQLLAARSYGVEIDVVIGVQDPVLGDGRYRLTGGPDGAICVRTDRSADVQLGVSELGAVSLGGTRLGQLARAGRVRAEDSRTLARLDLALIADRAPSHGTNF